MPLLATAGECQRALCHRNWHSRDRESIAMLRTACLLLEELAPTAGDQLRDGWYQAKLRSLYEAGQLHEYEVEEGPHHDRYLGVDHDELSLLDHVPTQELREVRMGGDGDGQGHGHSLGSVVGQPDAVVAVFQCFDEHLSLMEELRTGHAIDENLHAVGTGCSCRPGGGETEKCEEECEEEPTCHDWGPFSPL